MLRAGVAKVGLPADAVLLVDDVSHEAAVEVMQLTDFVDCLIPRGGAGLIQSVRENATVPVVIDGDGNCHVYVDAAADLDQALDIVVNAKTNRPSVCNAAESLLVHESVADAFLPARRATRSPEHGVELVGDEASRRRWPAMGAATDDDFARVPRPEDVGRGRRHARRRDRAREPLRHRPHRGDPHPRPRRGAAVHRTRSTPPSSS